VSHVQASELSGLDARATVFTLTSHNAGKPSVFVSPDLADVLPGELYVALVDTGARAAAVLGAAVLGGIL
jgi:hypothetical protein